MVIRVLGRVAVTDAAGSPIVLRSRLQQHLLAMLAVNAGSPVAADALVDALWGDALPDRPIPALRSQVFRLRRHLDPVGVEVATDGMAYRLVCDAEWIDAARFERLAGDARDSRDDPAAALRAVDEALGLWHGNAYAELGDHDAIRAEAARLEQLRLDTLEHRAELCLALGRPSEAGRTLDAVEHERPFSERPVELRMRALVREGRHADALRAFAEFRTRLGEDLGLEPSPDLCALEAQVLRHETPTLPAIGLPGNSFVGRDADLAEASGRLARARLVTLTGPGGVGKTRLAFQVANELELRFLDGVFVCELAKITDPDAVASTLADALRVEERGDCSMVDRMVSSLRTRRALLVIDNCEHVAAAARDVIEEILGATANVAILATSRRRLGVQGEQLVHVRPLEVPDGRDETAPSVRLFVDRAVAVRADLVLDDRDFDAVCELCRRVDGLPLGIELAAAACMTRSPAETLAELSDETARLADVERGVDRHRSLAAVVDWSYRLLSARDRAVCRNLAVFTGSFTAEAAAAVVGSDAGLRESLAALLDQSLLVADSSGPVPRHSMLEPIRRFARGRLRETGELPTASARHAAWAAAFVESADRGLRGPEERMWINAVGAEFTNLRSAHAWSLQHDPDTAARIVGGLFWYAYWHAPSEVVTWAEGTIERSADIAGRHLVGAFATAALGAWRRGDFARARMLTRAGLSHVPPDDPGAARFAWQALRSTETVAGDHDAALGCHDKVLALARDAGDPVHEAYERALGTLVLGYSGRLDDALAELELARSLVARAPNPSVDAMCDYVAGEIRADDDPAGALVFLQRAIDAARYIPNRFIAAVAGLSAVSCAVRLSNSADAVRDCPELIEYFHRAHVWVPQWTAIRSLIEALTDLARDEEAATLYGALTASPVAPLNNDADAIRILDAVRVLRARLGEDRFVQLQGRGAAFNDEKAVGFALMAAQQAGS